MNDKNNHPTTGLKWGIKEKIKAKDPRNFKRSKHFGATVNLASIPDFDLAPDRKVLNQFDSTFCTAFSSCEASGIQEGKELSPEYQIYKTRVITGGNPHVWGADPVAMCKSHTKFGALEQELNPHKLEAQGVGWVEDPANWKEAVELDSKAFEHRKNSFMEVDGYGNRFDSILATMWESYQASKSYDNISKLRPCILGLWWQPSWTHAEGGIIPEDSSDEMDKTLPHQVMTRGALTVVAVGMKQINGKLYIIIQNSWGTDYGNKGLFYISKEMLNRYSLFAKSFEDIDPKDAKQAQWGWQQQLINLLEKIVKFLTGNQP